MRQHALAVLIAPLVFCSCEAESAGPEAFESQAAVGAHVPSITTTDLGTLGGNQSVARGISERGHVVGYSLTAGGQTHPFVWTPRGGMVDLGTLGGENWNYGEAIAARGWIVGGSEVPGPCPPFSFCLRPVMWEHGTIHDLLPPGFAHGSATAVSARGQITIGAWSPSPAPNGVFVWSKQAGFEAVAVEGALNALDINNGGQVVGQILGGGTYLWDPRRGTTLLPANIHVVSALNNHGLVVGSITNGPGTDAVLWSEENGTTVLPTPNPDDLECAAQDINNLGEIVGTCFTASSGEVAVLWTADLVPHQLADGPSGAFAINERGQVAGMMAFDVPSDTRAVVWQFR